MAASSQKPLTSVDPALGADVASLSSCYNAPQFQSSCNLCEFVVSPTALLQREIDRRRVLAIISHPDAGKTTLTEKLLLYGGAIHLAGSVTNVTANSNCNSCCLEAVADKRSGC